jgi:hypothetical protein
VLSSKELAKKAQGEIKTSRKQTLSLQAQGEIKHSRKQTLNFLSPSFQAHYYYRPEQDKSSSWTTTILNKTS